MPVYRIPLEVDLRAFPPRATEVEVAADFALIAAHAGCDSELDLQTMQVQLPDGQTLPCQALPSSNSGLIVQLPAAVAALDGTLLSVIIRDRKDEGSPTRDRVVFSQGKASVDIRLGGETFATYRYDTGDPELPRPYFHPIIGSNGQPVTQDGEFPGTNRGHIWHTGLVLAHQNFTDGNNWQTGSAQFSRMRHLSFSIMESGPVRGRFVERLDWLNVRGDRTVFHETRTISVPYREPGRRCLDVDTLITCGELPAIWNATPYQLLALRMPNEMLVANGGVLTNSEGQVNPVDGAPAKWMDYSGNANRGGVTLFDHPSNPRHPTCWLNFKNETFGAAPTHREAYSWKPGEALRFRYRIFLHAGDVAAGQVAAEYNAYITLPQTRIGPPTRVA